MRLLMLLLVVCVLGSAAQETEAPSGFRWGPALRQSLLFLTLEHGGRMVQAKTRRELRGPFWRDYRESVGNLGGWGDGDSWATNNIAHPLQGAIAGYIQIQNDPGGVTQPFSRWGDYWRSRLKAMMWSAAYSTQFELGPFSEASLGNVGKKPGTMGCSDLVVTPVGGFGWIVAEDALDHYVIRRLDGRPMGRNWKRFSRSILNPSRSVANMLRLKPPWHRDTRWP